MTSIDICIIGAGPGGSTAALQLAKAGLSCTLFDKAVFPRDKICGDALSGKVVNELRRIDPSLVAALHQQPLALPSRGIHFIAPNEEWLSIPFHIEPKADEPNIAPGYLMRRLDFDQLLIEQVQQEPKISFQEGQEVTSYEKQTEGWKITTRAGQVYESKLLIVSNGAQSNFSRHIAGIPQEPAHFCAGLRAYYHGVEGLDPNGFIELHFLKPFLPGYFWIFPLADGYANVGVGMLSQAVSQKKINLKQRMIELIEQHPVLQPRFRHARRVDDIKGFGLPLGSKKRCLSGDHYMLIGDAAHLIDPFTGEGISNAMISGRWAAWQAINCFQNKDFSANHMQAYDRAVYNRLGNELKVSRSMQRLLSYPSLFNLVAKKSNKNPALKQLLSSMFNDIDLRSSLRNPAFYIKLLFNK